MSILTPCGKKKYIYLHGQLPYEQRVNDIIKEEKDYNVEKK